MSVIMLGPTTTEPAPFRGTRSASASTSLPCALPQVASPPDDRGTMFRVPSAPGPLYSFFAEKRIVRPLGLPPPILDLCMAQIRHVAVKATAVPRSTRAAADDD